MVLKYLNTETLSAIQPEDFHSRKPYPWANPYGILTEWGYRELATHMPDIAYFEKDFGSARKYGQPPHDRYRFWYNKTKGIIPTEWQAFIDELNGKEYHDCIEGLMRVKNFDLRLEWHYTVNGCSVSPHLDGTSTIGAHLFYFNLPEEWNEAWGGETLILDEGEKSIGMQSSPSFDDFIIHPIKHVGNYSSIFKNQSNAWHGVRELTSPAGVSRKIFTVFIEKRESPILKYTHRAKNIARRIKKVVTYT